MGQNVSHMDNLICKSSIMPVALEKGKVNSFYNNIKNIAINTFTLRPSKLAIVNMAPISFKQCEEC